MTAAPDPTPSGVELLQQYFTAFTPVQLAQFEQLGPLYAEWNEKINVISRKDIDALYERHILHSLSIAAVGNFAKGSAIIDIGTGGGFPGLPLAIFFPEVTFHLVDSIAKKLKVVDAIAKTIGLTNLTTQHTRAEEINNKKFDFAVSRAVAPLKELWGWSKPLLQHKNRTAGNELAPALLCLKGGDLAAEIQVSGTKPKQLSLSALFPLPFFEKKFLLYVPR
ncbi:MAG: 16S rRNA (guanine(527)-N(7))-methyltransferase RsmG [Bacteroidetes bacterium]|nr:16S rRNA (guanine(527)-N(7))-methyltransferase RsmG [Bacteroidota bacterium]